MRRPKDHILIIEDDAETRTGLVSLFLQNAFLVDTARETPEAIEKLKNSEFAAVIIDFDMICNSSNAIDFLRQEQPELLPRVIVVSRHPPRASPNHGLVERSFPSVVHNLLEPAKMVQAVRDCANRPIWW